MPRRLAHTLLIVCAIGIVLGVVLVGMRILAARPEWVWALAALPAAVLLLGPRTRAVVVVALCELAALFPLHALITLLRAARLEGG